MVPKLKYTGAGWGGSIHAVPARDLTDEDMARLRKQGHTIKSLLASGLYVKPPKEAAEEPGENEPEEEVTNG